MSGAHRPAGPSSDPATKTVAVMQPYFFPYRGYFRLFEEADEFILFDTAQFARRGRIHRCQVPGPGGSEEWLTLPLVRQPQETAIRDLCFTDDARERLDRRLERLPWYREAGGPNAARVREFLNQPLTSTVVDYLEDGLKLVNALLGIDTPMRRSSSLRVDPVLRGQERILALCRATGARRYVNTPGGRDLYDRSAFDAEGVELSFLPEYDGPHVHLLPALVRLGGEEIRDDLLGRHSSDSVR